MPRIDLPTPKIDPLDRTLGRVGNMPPINEMLMLKDNDDLIDHCHRYLPDDLKSVIFKGMELCPPDGGTNFRGGEGRDNAMISAVGTLNNRLAEFVGYSPQHSFALLYEAVSAFEPDARNPGKDWIDLLWSMCSRTYTEKYNRIQERLKQVQENHVKYSEMFSRTVAEVNGNLTDPFSNNANPRINYNNTFVAKYDDDTIVRLESCLRGYIKTWPSMAGVSPEILRTHLFRHSIGFKGPCFYLLGLDGTYIDNPISKDMIKTEVIRLGLDSHILVRKLDDKTGEYKDIGLDKILGLQAFSIAEVNYQVGKHTFVSGNSDILSLNLSINERRTDIIPTYSNEVDEWLRALFKDNYPIVCRWLAWALHPEEGSICGLSIAGPPNCGKSLLASGLIECYHKAVWADANDLIKDFNEGMIKSNILYIEYGLPLSEN